MLAIIRLRSSIGVRREIRDTLKLLRLNSINNCIIVPESPSYLGMIEKVKDFVTYGEINKETLTELLKNRLKTKDGKKVDENLFKEITNYDSFEKFAEDLINGKVSFKDFEKLEKVFKLKPAKGGLKSIKEHYPKGDLGYRGEKINELIKRMI